MKTKNAILPLDVINLELVTGGCRLVAVAAPPVRAGGPAFAGDTIATEWAPPPPQSPFRPASGLDSPQLDLAAIAGAVATEWAPPPPQSPFRPAATELDTPGVNPGALSGLIKEPGTDNGTSPVLSFGFGGLPDGPDRIPDELDDKLDAQGEALGIGTAVDVGTEQAPELLCGTTIPTDSCWDDDATMNDELEACDMLGDDGDNLDLDDFDLGDLEQLANEAGVELDLNGLLDRLGL